MCQFSPNDRLFSDSRQVVSEVGPEKGLLSLAGVLPSSRPLPPRRIVVAFKDDATMAGHQ